MESARTRRPWRGRQLPNSRAMGALEQPLEVRAAAIRALKQLDHLECTMWYRVRRVMVMLCDHAAAAAATAAVQAMPTLHTFRATDGEAST